MDRIWYVAYGTNLSRARFQCYLDGGTPAGGARANPGCRNPQPPTATVGVRVPGRLWFAGRSSVWGGGMAFFDGAGSGSVLGRAYLLTSDQFVDVVAQELRRVPGRMTVTELPSTGRHAYGPGGYETLVRLGSRSDVPMVTFTATALGGGHFRRRARPTFVRLHSASGNLTNCRRGPLPSMYVRSRVRAASDSSTISSRWPATLLRPRAT